MGNCTSHGNLSTKKLIYSSKELRDLSLQSNVHFNYQELKFLNTRFINLADKKRTYGGVRFANMLRLFDMSNMGSCMVSRNFISLFTTSKMDIETSIIYFDDFVYTYSIWTRGTLQQKITMLFRLLDQNNNNYLVKADLVDFMKNLIAVTLQNQIGGSETNNGVPTNSNGGDVYRAQILINELNEIDRWREISLYLENYFALHFPSFDEKRKIWLSDFIPFVSNQPVLMKYLSTPLPLLKWELIHSARDYDKSSTLALKSVVKTYESAFAQMAKGTKSGITNK